ncbi:MAG: hypothetical protein H6830_00810 [Planctomycetes bacterium]|nr:hypothetical protein [Planctomycetota bacterium]MCB9910985.1 hypothetical protein [Planctomycetota bacterium]HPF15146.1 hypothetical protein [Planctomycetota bacterium]HRV81651.1 hypothetical protein [Planctomycetota bacterium]
MALWLVVTSEDAPEAARMLHERELASMSPEEQAAAQSVIDLDAEQNSCPACLETIPGGAARCPGCGLRIG